MKVTYCDHCRIRQAPDNPKSTYNDSHRRIVVNMAFEHMAESSDDNEWALCNFCRAEILMDAARAIASDKSTPVDKSHVTVPRGAAPRVDVVVSPSAESNTKETRLEDVKPRNVEQIR